MSNRLMHTHPFLTILKKERKKIPDLSPEPNLHQKYQNDQNNILYMYSEGSW